MEFRKPAANRVEADTDSQQGAEPQQFGMRRCVEKYSATNQPVTDAFWQGTASVLIKRHEPAMPTRGA
jgi:hypothetical protein